MKRNRKLDQLLSVIVLLLYVVIITIRWIMMYQSVPQEAMDAVSIISTVIQCLTICVVLYNALGWTGSIILKIIFIVIAAFLIVSSVISWVPSIREVLVAWRIPV